MLDQLRPTDNKAVARCLEHALTAHHLKDPAALETCARLALDVAATTGDTHGQAMAGLLLGMARNDTWALDTAARTFERGRAYLDAGIALATRAAIEPNRARRVVLLQRALDHIEHARRRLAERGDAARWQAAGDIARGIQAGIEQAISGREWVS